MFVAALIANLQMNLAIALALALVFGLLIGLINGVIIAYLRVPPFIETLAMLFIVQGTNFQTTNGFPIFSGLTKSFLFIGQGYLGPLPMPFVITAVMFLVIHLFLEETVIMDEPPVSASNNRNACWTLRRVSQSKGVSVIYITHRMHDIFLLCDRIMVLKAGTNVGVFNKADVTAEDIVRMMIHF